MKAIEHLRTINHHKVLVMKGCFKVGLYRQGLMHDLSKPYTFGIPGGMGIIQATAVRIMQKGKQTEYLQRGFITRDAISIITNI